VVVVIAEGLIRGWRQQRKDLAERRSGA